MKKWIIMATLVLTLVTVGSTNAEDERYKKITAPEVKDMLDGGRALAIHVLSRIEYEMQHIPGSVNIPITEINTTDKLPIDENTPIIFYCMGLR
jgi:rhodanese-related sulfurtransferase